MLRLATRGSQLALWQARRVSDLLQAAHPGLAVELVPISTTGDSRPDVPLWEMGGQGVFVREVQAAVLLGQADAAVHSAKDLQPLPGPGLVLAAVPERADPRDALVGAALDELAPGAVVATGSQRRRAQLAAVRPDLRFESLRGNIATRLAKVPPGGAIVVALAALQRLGLEPVHMQVLGTEVVLPQVAQGALALECREDDARVLELVSAIDDPVVRPAVDAERAFLARLGGGCSLPVAGYATRSGEGQLHLEGLLAAPDGSKLVRQAAIGSSSGPGLLGEQVAQLVLLRGGRELLGATAG